jgi:hypothetical protein
MHHRDERELNSGQGRDPRRPNSGRHDQRFGFTACRSMAWARIGAFAEPSLGT